MILLHHERTVVAAPSPIHCQNGTVPPSAAPWMKALSSISFSWTQIGHTRYLSPARS
jgi:hypothetical protein